jgi:hypothetical protein
MLRILHSFPDDSFYEDDEAFLEAAKQIIETKKPDLRIVATKPKTPEDSFYNDDDFCEIIKEVVAEKKPPGKLLCSS